MLESIFFTIISMSIIASIIALFIGVIRNALGKYLPKSFSYYLWFIVLFRLILPINFSSSLSLFNFMPNTTTIISRVSRNIETEAMQNNINNVVSNSTTISQGNAAATVTPNSQLQIIFLGASIIWVLGMIFLIIRSIIRYYNASKVLDTATIIKDIDISHIKKSMKLNRNISIYSLDLLQSPLVYGLLKPKVIVPASMVDNIHTSESMQILAHEIHHIRRFDNILKLIWSIAICIHWFNPIVWLSAKYFNEDMELSCDEKVVKAWEDDIRKAYASSLINIADKQSHTLQGNFLFFGESNIKARVKNVMKFKKPKLLITLIGIILLGATTIFTLTNKKEQIIYRNENFGFVLTMDKKIFDKFKILEESSGVFFINKDVYEAYPYDKIGTVFRIEAYQKERVTIDDLEELNSIYNLEYIGENNKFYFGWAYPTDVAYPHDNEELKKSYERTTEAASKIRESIEIIEPGNDRYAYNENLKSAYEGFVDGVEFRLNSPAEEVVKNWGEPLDIGYLYGGLYLAYEDVVFYTDGYMNNDNSYTYGTIGRIDTRESYGIKAGAMTTDMVMGVLGEPDGWQVYDEEWKDPEGDIHPKAYYYAGDYTITISYRVDNRLVQYISIDDYRPLPVVGRGGFLVLNDNEKEAYERFIQNFDEKELNGLSVISILKLYLHCHKEGNFEAQWELYTKEDTEFGWDKKEHIAMRKKEEEIDFSRYFENPVNIEIDYFRDRTRATLSWEDIKIKNDPSNSPGSRINFRLAKNKDGIWKVEFSRKD